MWCALRALANVWAVGEEEGECGVDKAVHRDREQMETDDFF